MGKQFSTEEIARAFEVTQDQVRTACATTADTLDVMAIEANAHGGVCNYATESHLRERASAFRAKANARAA